MNFVIAQWEYGVATKNYELMIKAAKSGYSAVAFLDHLDEPLREFDAGQNRERVLRIGKLLRHDVDASEGTVFGTRVFGAQLQRAVRVVELYVQQETRVREAILAWRMVANRSFLCKDMVEMVAEMVWEARFEIQYGNDAIV